MPNNIIKQLNFFFHRISLPAKLNPKESQFDQVAAASPKRPESIPEERESIQEDLSSKSEVSMEDAKHRPGSPGRPSSPGKYTAGRTSPPMRPLSPGSTLPVIHHGRSDSAGSGGRAAAGMRAAGHGVIPRSSSSPTLMVPPVQLADKVKRPTDEEVRVVHIKQV